MGLSNPPPQTCVWQSRTPDGSDAAVFLQEAKFPGDDETDCSVIPLSSAASAASTYVEGFHHSDGARGHNTPYPWTQHAYLEWDSSFCGQRAGSASSLRHSLIRSSTSADRLFAVCVDTLSHAADSGTRKRKHVTFAKRDCKRHRTGAYCLPAPWDPPP